MKRLYWMLLLLGLLVLAGCGAAQDPAAGMEQPFSFYYRTVRTDMSGPEGVICPELRDLGTETLTDTELFRLYLEGPQSPELVSPVPKGCELMGAIRSSGVLILNFRQAYDALTGIDQSIANACLLKTALQLEGIRQVEFRIHSTGGQLLADVTLSESDLSLYDAGTSRSGTDAVLYWADADRKYLRTEKRQIPETDRTSQAKYIVEQLLQSPETSGLVSPLPQGTGLWSISVDQQVCAVDFSADFFNNRPETRREELLVLYSVVNSLCELDGIDQVQFYVEGRRQSRYVWLDISGPFQADPAVAGPIREDMNEFEAVLCLPCDAGGLLYRLPIRLWSRSGESREETLLDELFSRPSQNGLSNPLSALPRPLSAVTGGGLCSVRLAQGSLSALDESGREACIRILTASLCALSGVSSVQITEEDGTAGKALRVDPGWFCDGSEP